MRRPAVAGTFYPAEQKELAAMIDSLLREPEYKHQAIAGIAPHAGYVYSGATAAWTYANLRQAKTFVIIGPDHTGMSLGRTCIGTGEWATPLGTVAVDEELAKQLGPQSEAAHYSEHSIEVQIPFLQRVFKEFRIVPVLMGDQSMTEAVKLGEKLAKHECTVIASSDFSHYVPRNQAHENDNYALEALERLDVKDFYSRIEERGISACGYGPIAAAATFAKQKKCTKGLLLDYSTSPGENVVGYASMVFV